MAAVVEAASPAAPYHRGDPLDIPLIDDHLLARLLLPRLTSAIKLAFPGAHLDWTTGVAASHNEVAIAIAGGSGGGGGNGGGSAKNALVWKRIVEGALRAMLLVGSCRHVCTRDKQREVRVQTPAMQNLGMILRPTFATGASKSRVQRYIKIAALVLATVVMPSLYEELKRRRQRQLDDRERRRRLEEIRRELRGSAGRPSQQHQSEAEQQPQQPTQQQRQSTQQLQVPSVRQRARERQSRLRSVLADALLGLGDVFLPPLKLMSYISYLWGGSAAPGLGVRLAGWEYAAEDDGIAGNAGGNAGGNGGYFGGRPHQRHANFQYGNRRLMVEEGLRTMAMVLPPRGSGAAGADGGGGNGPSSIAIPRASGAAPRTAGRRRGGMRRRALSFLGVAEEGGSESAALDGSGGPLACAMCHTENPTIPYVASCGHGYCYLCLRAAVTDDLGFRCVACGRAVVSSGRPAYARTGQRVASFPCKSAT